MANIIPAGIDATTGQQRPLTSSDTLTDSSGTAVTSGAGGWELIEGKYQASGTTPGGTPH